MVGVEVEVGVGVVVEVEVGVGVVVVVGVGVVVVVGVGVGVVVGVVVGVEVVVGVVVVVIMNLEQEEREIETLAGQLTHLEQTITREEDELEIAGLHLKRTQDAQEILQRLAQAVQQQAHKKISDVVSSCLSTVFGDEAYQFKIEFERKRGRTEAHLRFLRGDLDVDPLTASGGGMIDIAGAALRLSCLMLHRPRLSKIVVLDEPFRFVSVEYQENVREMLEGLAKDLGVQFILVTHNQALAAGKVVEL